MLWLLIGNNRGIFAFFYSEDFLGLFEKTRENQRDLEKVGEIWREERICKTRNYVKLKKEVIMESVLRELASIIEDRHSLEQGLRIIMEAAERKKLPEEVFLPTFNDSMLEETFVHTLEAVVGERYE